MDDEKLEDWLIPFLRQWCTSGAEEHKALLKSRRSELYQFFGVRNAEECRARIEEFALAGIIHSYQVAGKEFPFTAQKKEQAFRRYRIAFEELLNAKTKPDSITKPDFRVVDSISVSTKDWQYVQSLQRLADEILRLRENRHLLIRLQGLTDEDCEHINHLWECSFSPPWLCHHPDATTTAVPSRPENYAPFFDHVLRLLVLLPLARVLGQLLFSGWGTPSWDLRRCVRGRDCRGRGLMLIATAPTDTRSGGRPRDMCYSCSKLPSRVKYSRQ